MAPQVLVDVFAACLRGKTNVPKYHAPMLGNFHACYWLQCSKPRILQATCWIFTAAALCSRTQQQTWRDAFTPGDINAVTASLEPAISGATRLSARFNIPFLQWWSTPWRGDFKTLHEIRPLARAAVVLAHLFCFAIWVLNGCHGALLVKPLT
jgi:hypothetical protein